MEWLEKYKPTCLANIINDENKNIINNIIKWIKNYKTNPCAILYGDISSGKKTIIKNICKEIGFKEIIINYNDLKNEKLISDLDNINIKKRNNVNNVIENKNKKGFIVIIKDIDDINYNNKKNFINLFRYNLSNKKYPLLIITKYNYNKTISDIKINCIEFKLESLNLTINKICENISVKENFNLTTDHYEKIVQYSQNDIRKFISILYYYKKDIYDKKMCSDDISTWLNIYRMKDKHNDIFKITKLLLENKHIDNGFNIYAKDNILLPLMIFHNIPNIINNYNANIDKISEIYDSISFGDIISNKLYMINDITLNNFYGFYECILPCKIINTLGIEDNVKLDFCSELNKMSTKSNNTKVFNSICSNYKLTFEDLFFLSKFNKKYISKLYNNISVKNINDIFKLDF